MVPIPASVADIHLEFTQHKMMLSCRRRAVKLWSSDVSLVAGLRLSGCELDAEVIERLKRCMHKLCGHSFASFDLSGCRLNFESITGATLTHLNPAEAGCLLCGYMNHMLRRRQSSGEAFALQRTPG